MSTADDRAAKAAPESPVDTAKRALRHRAHRYHVAKDESKAADTEALYAAARAMVAAEQEQEKVARLATAVIR